MKLPLGPSTVHKKSAPGSSYRMDIFHAERHTDFSTFRIETTIQCVTVIVVD